MPHITAPRVRIREIRGRIKRYRVRDLVEVDGELVGLFDWLNRQITSAPRFGLDHIRRFRADQDLLLDMRLRLMAERDARTV